MTAAVRDRAPAAAARADRPPRVAGPAHRAGDPQVAVHPLRPLAHPRRRPAARGRRRADFALGEQPPNAAMLLAVLGSLVGMLLIAVGVLATAGEWTHGTVQTTFLAVPRRGRVLAATVRRRWPCSARCSPPFVVGSVYAVAAVGTDPGFGWQGAVPAALATVSHRRGAHRRRRRHRRRRGQRAGRADRHLPGAAGRHEHPQRGQAGVGPRRRPARGDLQPDRAGRRPAGGRGAGRLGPGDHGRRRGRHPPPRHLLTTPGAH